MKIGVYVGHDDDAILGCGGTIVQQIQSNNSVYVVVATDGRNSHKEVLGTVVDPTPLEIKEARGKEIKAAMRVLDVNIMNLHLLEMESATLKNKFKILVNKLTKISMKEKPDMVFFHYPDAHITHQIVRRAVIKAFSDLSLRPKFYQFPIWTEEFSKGRFEVDAKNILTTKGEIVKIDIQNEINKKKEALYKMNSQVLKHPYPNWGKQKKSILDKKFIEWHLRGEEVFII